MRSVAFDDLWRQLREEHDRELHSLRTQIEELRGRAMMNSNNSLDYPMVSVVEDRVRDRKPTSPTHVGLLATSSDTACEGRQAAPHAEGPRQDLERPPETISPSAAAASVVAPCAVRETTEESDAEVAGSPKKTTSALTRGRSKQRAISSDRRAVLAKYTNALDSRSARGRGIFEKVEQWVRTKLDMWVGTLIVINIAFVYLDLEYAGHKVGIVVGARGAMDWPDMRLFLQIMPNIFTALFLLEMMLKVYFLRMEVLFHEGRVQKFNVFDMIIVALTILDKWILTSVGTLEPSVMRLLRVVRIARTLRIVRTFEIFSKLRVLVSTVVASIFALFWSIVLLTVLMLMTALVLCDTLNGALSSGDIVGELAEWVYRYYGTPTMAFWSVFELTFSGGWPNYVRPLVEEVSPGYAVFFAIYIYIVVFSMFRIITALFLKDALAVAAADTESMIADKIATNEKTAQALLDFFVAADSSGDGCLTWGEFEDALQSEHVEAYLANLELDVTQSRRLFEMLDDGDQKVSAEEFVRGALRLRGTARSQDVVEVICDCKKVMKHLARTEYLLHEVRDELTYGADWNPTTSI